MDFDSNFIGFAALRGPVMVPDLVPDLSRDKGLETVASGKVLYGARQPIATRSLNPYWKMFRFELFRADCGVSGRPTRPGDGPDNGV